MPQYRDPCDCPIISLLPHYIVYAYRFERASIFMGPMWLALYISTPSLYMSILWYSLVERELSLNNVTGTHVTMPYCTFLPTLHALYIYTHIAWYLHDSIHGTPCDMLIIATNSNVVSFCYSRDLKIIYYKQLCNPPSLCLGQERKKYFASLLIWRQKSTSKVFQNTMTTAHIHMTNDLLPRQDN